MVLKEFKVACIILLWTAMAQAQYSLSGTVLTEDNAPLPDAEVYVKELRLQTKTAANGAYTLSDIPPGTYTIATFAFGYKVNTLQIQLSGDKQQNVVLQPLSEQLSEVVLIQEREKAFALQRLKKVEGTAIYAAKKSEVVILDQLTANVAANNPRQIYSQVAGLNIYENGDGGLQLNIGGRGLDPNRTANFNVRQNGYDISADALGYPESYYTPPAEALSEIQIVRGAASLQYGPQFGGLINFKFKQPNPTKELELVSRQSLGSYGLFTSFNSLSGTVGRLGYYTYFHYKEGSSFRPNSDYSSRNFYGHFDYKLSDNTKLAFEATKLNYLAQQPGGITDLQLYQNPAFSNRERNWFQVDWNLFSLRLDHRFSSKTDFSLNLFTLDASRKALGIRDTDVKVQDDDDPEKPRDLLADHFKNWGAEARLLTRYTLFTQEAVALLGVKYYQTYNTQQQGPGSATAGPDFSFATEEFPDYPNQSRFTFPNLNLAVFGEHIFTLSDKLSVTPGFRFEHIKTESEGVFGIQEKSGNRVFARNFLLLGIGALYTLSAEAEVYANISQNYRAVTMNDIRVINVSLQIDEDISDESGFTVDVGIRGQWGKLFSYNLSGFSLFYNDRIGEIAAQTGGGSVRGNIGSAVIYGLESLVDWNVKNTFFPRQQKVRLNTFVNLALTNSQYTKAVKGNNNVKGHQVEFTPNVNLKTGLNFGYGNLLGSLQYTYLSEQFSDATNAPQVIANFPQGIIGAIPAFSVMDFSLAYTFTKHWKLEAGVNNLLNETYFVRRATGYPGPGIIPSEPRTFYTTLQCKL